MKTNSSLLAVTLVGVGILTYVGLTACGQAPSKEVGSSKTAADEAAIMDTVENFEKAFNAGDAKAVAAEYTDDGEMVNEDGDVFQGREAIEKEFTAMFAEVKGSKIKIDVESIRFVGPGLAVEEGTALSIPADDGPQTKNKYTAFHVQKGNDWKLASTRSLESENISAHEHLKQLDWLVGDWVDESPNAVVKHHCEWSEDGNFLLVDFQLEVDGLRKMKGTQRIGYDPLYKQLKSWVFDSQGGFAEGHWTFADNSWIVKVTGVRSDGAVATSTNIYAPIDKDQFNWSSTGRVVGGALEPDVKILIVRKPPEPSLK